MTPPAPVNLAPALQLLLLAALLALLPLALWAWRQRHEPPRQRLRALLALTALLTFDLIVVGAFTRLTDSGLGCPDWPGCYGQASPLGAQAHIQAAQVAQPSGPVTHTKAWIEMAHRYMAMAVGALCLALAVLATRWRQALPYAAGWAWATLAWVVVQGLFGKYTVTLKLLPAVVTLHLLGAAVLLGLLVAQWAWLVQRPAQASPGRATVGLVLGVLLLQMALGGWVSSNYAVLACRGFPDCNGQWWPAMDWAHGFTLWRELGRAADGSWLPFDALVAVHMAHRLMALVAVAALLALAWRLRGLGQARAAAWLAGLTALQVGSGLSNVVLGWPLLAALLHSAGAAALVAQLVHLWASAGAAQTAPQPAWHAKVQAS